MTTKLLIYFEIDTNDKFCGECGWNDDGDCCMNFFEADTCALNYNEYEEKYERSPECLQAEECFKKADGAVTLNNLRAGKFT